MGSTPPNDDLPDGEFDPSLADEVDAALAAVWDGKFDELDRLVDSVSPGDQIADIFGPLHGRSTGAPSVPEAIGRYRIIRELGRGGMGVVFEAEQSEPRRRVALKIIRGGRFVDDYQRRLFQREIQTLAHLNHPGIAALYDAGQTDDGLNYYAMELVEGRALAEYVRRPNEDQSGMLSIRRRVEMMAAVCDSIQYAHQRGVIHRDLKPSNIFVTAEGQPKVLDFGLARLTSPDSDAPTVNTTPGQVLGTLPYMSPEQARGESSHVDIRTDIYALGVITYELLTGLKPLDLGGTPVPEAVRRICEQTPKPLGSTDRTLRGDLATIVHKALAKEAALRYASAAALGDDLRAYLAGMPISARPPSTGYHVRKLIARHRLPFALASLLVVSAFTFAILASRQAVMLAKERDAAIDARREAEANQKKSERINEILQTMLSSVDPELSSEGAVTVPDVLDNMAAEVDRGIIDDRDVEAAVRRTIGCSYLSLGDLDAAEKQLRRSYEIRKEMFGDRHPWTGRILSDLGELLRGRGEHAAAADMQTRALSILTETLESPHADAAKSRYRLALVLDEQGKLEEAESLLREVLMQHEKLPEVDIFESFRVRLQLGSVVRNLGKYAEAEALFVGVMDDAEKSIGADHQIRARAMNGLALLYEEQGRYKESANVYRESLRIKRLGLPKDHPSIAVTLSNLGAAERRLGNLDAAEKAVSEALDAMTSRFGPDYWQAVVITNNLAGLRRARGDFAGAESMYRDVIQHMESRFGPEHQYVAGTLNNLGAVLRDAGKWEESAEVLTRAYELTVKVRGAKHMETARTAENLGAIHQALGRLDEAEKFYQIAIECIEAAMGPDHPIRIAILNDLSSVRRERGDCAKALQLATTAREACEGRDSASPEEIARSLGELGQSQLCAGRTSDAIRTLELSLAQTPRYDQAGLFREEVKSALALAYISAGKRERATILMSEALEPFVLREGRFGKVILQRAVRFYEEIGDMVEAANWQNRLDELTPDGEN